MNPKPTNCSSIYSNLGQIPMLRALLVSTWAKWTLPPCLTYRTNWVQEMILNTLKQQCLFCLDGIELSWLLRVGLSSHRSRSCSLHRVSCPDELWDTTRHCNVSDWQAHWSWVSWDCYFRGWMCLRWRTVWTIHRQLREYVRRSTEMCWCSYWVCRWGWDRREMVPAGSIGCGSP